MDAAGNIYGTTFGGGLGNDAGTVFRLSPPAKGNQWTLQTIYSFCVAKSSCHDGLNRNGGLTYSGREAGLPYDGVSPLYGTATGGGGRFGGVAYSLTPKPRGPWSQKVLYAFCKEGGQSCTDGAAPIQRLTMDLSGNLYGITSAGGANLYGVAFKLSQQEGQKQLSESVIYDFCGGCIVQSGLSIDQSGNLFGSSWTGGNSPECTFDSGCGFIFEIAPSGTESVVYDFCSLSGCADGEGPFSQGGILVDNAGDLYGTTHFGGDNGQGVLFRLVGGSAQMLYNFCSEKNCVDEGIPFAGLIMNSAGQIYGATLRGGANGDGGTIFELTP